MACLILCKKPEVFDRLLNLLAHRRLLPGACKPYLLNTALSYEGSLVLFQHFHITAHDAECFRGPLPPDVLEKLPVGAQLFAQAFARIETQPASFDLPPYKPS